MAEPTPGQVITPGGGQTEPPKEPVAPVQEVSVNLNNSTAPPQPVSPPAPVQVPSASKIPQPQQQPNPTTLPTQPPQPLPTSPLPSPEPVVNQQSSEPVFVEQQEPVSSFAPQYGIGQTEPDQLFEEPLDVEGESISWTASEYIAHQKTSGWYLTLAAITVIFAALVYVITGGDVMSVIVIVLAAVVFGIYASKKPKEQQYAISPVGISIGAKTYGFELLKTFSITDEGAFSSITFWPMKRFMPALSIYYDPQDEDRIVETLSNYLPMDVQKRDAVDNFMRKIRF